MQKLKAPRGTQDILPADSQLWQEIEHAALQVCNSAGYKEIRTPHFEATELFCRAVGEDSDIVNKEMYTFLDKSDRSMTLRPEGTAGVVRAYIESALDRGPKPCKLWYRGPMFRYERPQTGRYRQFHQIGVEAFGSKSPHLDVETIGMGLELLKNLGLENLVLYINSIGTSQSRAKYRDVLKEFLLDVKDKVCEDCQRRIEQNPLRALDCKVPEDQELYKNAPVIYDYFDDESKEFWDKTRSLLNELGIEYKEDPKLVRGLDYYSHCVFEIKVHDKNLGQQNTVLAGGRYDALVSMLGGPETPAVGWALGIERLSILLKEYRKDISKQGVYIVSDDLLESQKLAQNLRRDLGQAVSVEYDFDSARIGKQIEKADKRSCRYVVFYMEDERNSAKFKVKDLESGEEKQGLDYKQLVSNIM